MTEQFTEVGVESPGHVGYCPPDREFLGLLSGARVRAVRDILRQPVIDVSLHTCFSGRHNSSGVCSGTLVNSKCSYFIFDRKAPNHLNTPCA